MKRKLKLFLSILSMCVSLSILCFGVYAASQVNYTATGTVTYVVESVFTKIETTYIQYATGLKKTLATETAVLTEANSVTDWEDVTDEDGDPLILSKFSADTGYDPNKEANIDEALPNFDLAKGCIYRIVVNVNLYQQASKVDLIASMSETESTIDTAKTNAHWFVVSSESDEASDSLELTNIDVSGAAKTITLTYYIALNDITQNAGGAFTVKVNLKQSSSN